MDWRSAGWPPQRPRARAQQSHFAIRNIAAAGTALAFHLLVLGLVGLSLARGKVEFTTPPDQAGMYVSLVSAASTAVDGAPPATRPSPVEMLNDALEQPAQVQPARPTSSAVDQLLAQMDAARLSPAALRTSAAAPAKFSAPASVALQSAENPWAHASSVATDSRFTGKFWAALKPCWKGDYNGATSNIRVVLDGAGRIQAMTLLDDADAPARARAELVAEALVACEPYRIGQAGAFLVRAPA